MRSIGVDLVGSLEMSGSQVYLLNLESQEIQKNSVAPFYDSLIDYFCNFSCHPALVGQRMRSIASSNSEVNRFTSFSHN